ncbi:hypothetical protein GCM10009609_30510 [Pseudonocardia aurantiaca]
MRRVSARRALTDPVVTVVIVPPGSLVSFVLNLMQHPRGLDKLARCEADDNPLASPVEADEYPVQRRGGST